MIHFNRFIPFLEENYESMAEKWEQAVSHEEYYKELKAKINEMCKKFELDCEFCY